MRPEIAAALQIEAAVDELPIALSSRLGTYYGFLHREPLYLVGEGEGGGHLRLEATWFVSPEWQGPLVLGWRGCLERMRFAIDPGGEWFYFGEMEGEHG